MMPQRKKCKERSSPEPQTKPPSPKHVHNMPSSSSSSSPAVDNVTSPFNPPGVRFVPNDEDIIFILNDWKSFPERFINSQPDLPVHRVNIYQSNPLQLSEDYKKGNLKEWFFISERTKTNKGGKRQKRGDINGGYWHATVAAKKIEAGEDIVGYKTALDYYNGKPSNGVKTDWLMHEYWLEPSQDNDNKTVDYSLCKIYLSPMAKKKKKQESVEDSEEEVELPTRGALQQPHQLQFSLSSVDPLQPQAEEQHQLLLSSSAVDSFSSPFQLPGYKFVPNDEDIIFILLNWKSFPQGYINSWLYFPVYHVNIYESNPEQLSAEYNKGNREEWFFMSKRTKTCKGGKRQKRGDNGGYWHATTATKKIKVGEDIVGYKTALDYHIGKPSDGIKTNWLMHEYWVEPKPSQDNHNDTVEHYFLCKIYLSPMAKKKKKEEAGVEASEEKVEQPSNVASQQPLVQKKQPTNVAFLLPQVQEKQPSNVASQQPLVQQKQPTNVAFQRPQVQEKQPSNVAFQQPQEQEQQSSNVAFQLPQVQEKQPTNVEFQLPQEQEQQPTNAAFQKPQEQDQQPSNVALQQPQEQEQHPSNVAFQQPLEQQKQPRNVAFQLPQVQEKQLSNVADQQPQEQQKQPSNVADQKPHQPEFCLPPVDSLQPQAEEEEKWPLPFISDELIEMLNDHNIPDDVDGLFPPYDDLFTPEDKARFLEEIARDAVKKRNTLLT